MTGRGDERSRACWATRTCSAHSRWRESRVRAPRRPHTGLPPTRVRGAGPCRPTRTRALVPAPRHEAGGSNHARRFPRQENGAAGLAPAHERDVGESRLLEASTLHRVAVVPFKQDGCEATQKPQKPLPVLHPVEHGKRGHDGGTTGSKLVLPGVGVVEVALHRPVAYSKSPLNELIRLQEPRMPIDTDSILGSSAECKCAEQSKVTAELQHASPSPAHILAE